MFSHASSLVGATVLGLGCRGWRSGRCRGGHGSRGSRLATGAATALAWLAGCAIATRRATLATGAARALARVAATTATTVIASATFGALFPATFATAVATLVASGATAVVRTVCANRARTGRIFGRFSAGLGQHGIELIGRDALERAKVGCRQLGGLEAAQQRSALAATGFFLLALGLLVATAAGQLFQRDLAVLFGELTSGLAVEVEALLGLRCGDQVGRGARVAAQEGRQHLLGELTGRALLDVGLDAQLQRLGLAAEQRREQLGQAGLGVGDAGLTG
jgi:hypothetical protein